MKEELISKNEAMKVMRGWQADERSVEVVVRFNEGLTQTHAGRLTVEPDGQVVVAQVINKDQYQTTLVDVSPFDSIRLLESMGAITFTDHDDPHRALKSVTIAVLAR